MWGVSTIKLNTTQILGNAGQIIGAIITYNLNGSPLCLPATVLNGNLSLGLCQPSAYLLNQSHIDLHPSSTVILCVDMTIAIDLDAAVKNSTEMSSKKVFITAHLGNNLKVIPWNYLERQHVILIPSPNSTSYENVELYQKLVMKAGASSFRIYPFWILHTAISKTPDTSDLIQKSIIIEDIDRIYPVIKSIEKNSMPLKDFISWGQNSGLFVIPQKNEHDKSMLSTESDSSLTISCLSLADIDSHSRDYTAPVTIDEFFYKNYTSLLWGPSDVGKTWIARHFAISYAFGISIFFLAASSSPVRRRVVYIDGEIGKEKLNHRFAQVCEAIGISFSDLESYIDIISLDGKTLLNEKVQAQILELSISKRWELLIIDNIQACAPEASKGRSVHFNQFITKLKNNKCGTLLVHHATKNGDTFKCDGALEDLSQNIIHLESVEPGDLREACEIKDSAVLTKMTVTKCKVDGNTFKNKSAIYQLPIGGAWEYVEGDLPHYDLSLPAATLPQDDMVAIDEGQVSDSHKEYLRNLSPKEEKLYKFMKEKGKFYSEDIKNYLHVSIRTANNRLKKFINAKIITCHGGKGISNTYYTFND